MSLRRSSALVRHEFRILRHDPLPFVLSFVLPLVMMWLLRDAFRAIFASTGGPDNGAAQAVPGMVVLYAMFLVANVAFGFLRERDWHTWARLRGAGPSAADLTAGKLFPGFCAITLLMAVLFAVGTVAFRLDIHGSVLSVGVLIVLFGAWLTACGGVIARLCRTAPQATAMANLLALCVGGFGGALIPAETLPEWVQVVAHANPAWWVMQGFRGSVTGEVSPTGPILVLTAWLVVTGAIAVVTVDRAYGDKSRR